ncbi:TrkA family potassium uptake protein [Halanaeroarchaeum sp. HSR-CO]|uniref:potassium channel family protein n=1 Tax=Halanaeroarchaeum sp. HSR-CO TaxID=2866382 RepID=UPI00217D9460|nr:NAD(P)-binding protein [Halanaeroarchaeum sp. HSR-CO]
MNPIHAVFRAFARRSLLRRLLRPILAFAAVVVAGVVGFRLIAGVGIIEALFWLLDPTSIELYFQHHDGPVTLVKAYAIVVLSGLVVAGLWTGETVFSAAFGGRITEEVNRMQMQSSIDELENHVVVCGYGTFGKTIANRLAIADRPVVVVEADDVQYERALADDHFVVQGDARREDALTAAGIDRASTVIGAVDDTDTNVKVAVTASQLAPMVRVVVRAGDEMDEAVARRVGADKVIVPEVVSGDRVFETL